MLDEAFCTAELWPLDDFLDICPELNRGNRVSVLVRSCLFQLAVRLRSPLLGGQPDEALVISAWLDPADAGSAAQLWNQCRNELGIGEPRPALDGNKLKLLAAYTGDMGVAGEATCICTVDLVNARLNAEQFAAEVQRQMTFGPDEKLLVFFSIGDTLVIIVNSQEDAESISANLDPSPGVEFTLFDRGGILALNGVNNLNHRV
jgi:hypothetical protein